MDNVRIRAETGNSSLVDQAHLETFRDGRWESEELNSQDTWDAAWLLEQYMNGTRGGRNDQQDGVRRSNREDDQA